MNWGKWTQKALEMMNSVRELEQEPNMPAGHLALLTGARGITRSCLTACAASTQAIGEAAMILRQGKADKADELKIMRQFVGDTREVRGQGPDRPNIRLPQYPNEGVRFSRQGL